MKKQIDILHIYAGTSGAAGLYLDEIHLALNEKYKQEVVVSYNYPFNYGKKWFYRFSDISSIGLKALKIRKIRYIVIAGLSFFETLICSMNGNSTSVSSSSSVGKSVISSSSSSMIWGIN